MALSRVQARWNEIRAWAKSHPAVVDGAFAALLFVATMIGLLVASPLGTERDADLFGVFLVVPMTVPLGWRRRAPLRTLMVVTPAVIAFWVLDYSTQFEAASLLATYAAAAHGGDRRRTWQVVGTCVAALSITAVVGVVVDEENLPISAAIGVAITASMAAAIGEVMHSRRQRVADLEQRALRAEADREANARQAVIDERVRIARELHDVVAHGMSAMVVQAAAAERVYASTPTGPPRRWRRSSRSAAVR